MTDFPAYSVVIPAHNAAPFIGATLRSIRSQDIPAHEVIVVDDRSTDDTAAIAMEHGANVVAARGPRGPAAARNLGVQEATAPLVAFIDADDEWHPHHARLLLEVLTKTGAVFASGALELFGSAEGIERADLPGASAIDMRARIFLDNPISQSGVIVSREEILAVGGYDETISMSEDYELWIRLSTRGVFAYSPAVTVRRRVHAQQLTHANDSKLIGGAWHARRLALSARAGVQSPTEHRAIIENMRQAAQRDLRNAIQNGDLAALYALRSELRLTDAQLAGDAKLSAVVGAGHPLRAAVQELRCQGRSWLRKLRQR